MTQNKKRKVYSQNEFIRGVQMREEQAKNPKVSFWSRYPGNPLNFKNHILHVLNFTTTRFFPRLSTGLVEYRKFILKEQSKSFLISPTSSFNDETNFTTFDAWVYNTFSKFYKEKKYNRTKFYRYLRTKYVVSSKEISLFDTNNKSKLLNFRNKPFQEPFYSVKPKFPNYYNKFGYWINLCLSFHTWEDKSIFSYRALWWLFSYGATIFLSTFILLTSFFHTEWGLWYNFWNWLMSSYDIIVYYLSTSRDMLIFGMERLYMILVFEGDLLTVSLINCLMAFFILCMMAFVPFFDILENIFNAFILFLNKTIGCVVLSFYDPQFLAISLWNSKINRDRLLVKMARSLLYKPGVLLNLKVRRFNRIVQNWVNYNITQPIKSFISALNKFFVISWLSNLFKKIFGLMKKRSFFLFPKLLPRIILRSKIEYAFANMIITRLTFFFIWLFYLFLLDFIFLLGELGAFILYKDSIVFDGLLILCILWRNFVKSIHQRFPKYAREVLSEFYLRNTSFCNFICTPVLWYFVKIIIWTNLWVFPVWIFFVKFLVRLYKTLKQTF